MRRCCNTGVFTANPSVLEQRRLGLLPLPPRWQLISWLLCRLSAGGCSGVKEHVWEVSVCASSCFSSSSLPLQSQVGPCGEALWPLWTEPWSSMVHLCAMKTIDHRADSWFAVQVIDRVSLNQTWPEGPVDVDHVCLGQYQPGLFLTEQYDLLTYYRHEISRYQKLRC